MPNYSKGKISIPNVTGNIVINITAIESADNNLFPNQFFDTDGVTLYNAIGYMTGKRFSKSSFGLVSTKSSICMTGYLAVNAGDVITISGAAHTLNDSDDYYMALTYYDANHNPIGSSSNVPPLGTNNTLTANGEWIIPSGVSYIRIGCDTAACAADTKTLFVTKS